MKIAVIPARGGSKRVPKKNIRSFCGRPIISYSINAALSSGCFDEVIVSTDDEEISEVARQYGAKVPFVRPDNLAGDFACTSSVVAHAIDWLESEDYEPGFVCCIYATAPFLREADLKNGLALIVGVDVDYVFTATTYQFPLQRAFRLAEGKTCKMLDPDHANTRSQDLEEFYHDAGQFYWGHSKTWLNRAPIFLSKSIPVILPRYRVQDIDTLEDWKQAELMFDALRSFK